MPARSTGAGVDDESSAAASVDLESTDAEAPPGPWMVKAALLPTLLFVGRGVGDAVRLTNMLRRRLALG